MFVPYHCCNKTFEDYYSHQTGNGLNYYRGATFQRGYGFGGFFRSLFRAAVPLFKSGGKVIGQELLKSGINVLNDVSHGNNIKESAKKHFKSSAHILSDKAAQKVKNMIGSGRKRNNKKRKLTRKQLISSKAKKVKAYNDIFS